ncbi:MAG: calcium/sodium antiporter [Bacteroidales bacterium]|nr:calcium/sodium antiporter [Bacteroidales bacterium]
MPIVLTILLILVGFALLIFGAEWLVSGASALARKYNISELAIGLTIVAFGTSAPELVVNAVASFDGHADIVLGNIIGSNNFNLFIILAVAALIYPIRVQSTSAWREVPMSFAITLLFLVLANDIFSPDATLTVSRLDGLVLLALFGGFLWYVATQMKNEPEKEKLPTTQSTGKIWLLIIAGLAGLVIGGKLVVDYGVELATYMGISEKIIGLTIIAAGTSLPELVTAIVAALKKKSDIVIGNVIGSNIFNLLLILPVSSLIRPIAYSPAFNTELIILSAGTLFLFISMLTGKRKHLDRWEAAILLGFYLSYTVYMILDNF